jgi:hypothetical protein
VRVRLVLLIAVRIAGFFDRANRSGCSYLAATRCGSRSRSSFSFWLRPIRSSRLSSRKIAAEQPQSTAHAARRGRVRPRAGSYEVSRLIWGGTAAERGLHSPRRWRGRAATWRRWTVARRDGAARRVIAENQNDLEKAGHCAPTMVFPASRSSTGLDELLSCPASTAAERS